MFDVGQMSTLDSCVKHFGVGHPSVFHLCSGRWVNISPALHSLAQSTFEHPHNINILLLYVFMYNVHCTYTYTIYIVLYYVIYIQLILVGPLSRPTSDLEDLEGERGGEGGFT